MNQITYQYVAPNGVSSPQTVIEVKEEELSNETIKKIMTARKPCCGQAFNPDHPSANLTQENK